MSLIHFPDPRTSNEDGLLLIGGDLSCQNLVRAYSIGVFPWPQPDLPLLWFSPLQRGVIDFHEFHIPKRLKAYLKNAPFEITIDQNFRGVMEACSQAHRKMESGTWILPEMIEAYTRLHESGYAHSFECWQEGDLVGGLYGVYIHSVFSGESMFFKKSHASKKCLIAAIEHLSRMGLKWMDVQMVTPVVQSFGGKYISRNEFLNRMEEQREKNIPFVSHGVTSPLT